MNKANMTSKLKENGFLDEDLDGKTNAELKFLLTYESYEDYEDTKEFVEEPDQSGESRIVSRRKDELWLEDGTRIPICECNFVKGIIVKAGWFASKKDGSWTFHT